MRVLWIILLLLVAVGAASLWNQLHAPANPDAAALRAAAEAVSGHADDPAKAPAAPTPPAATSPATSVPPPPRADDAGALADELLASSAARASTVDGGGAVRAHGDVPPTSVGATPGEPVEPLAMGRDARIKGATIVPGAIMRTADGTIRADDRFTIRGAGTRDDPYRVSWELLASASETFQPRLGETKLPQRVAMLDGAWVRIEGYVAFPVYSFDPTELLVMLNQWDGCCIGVPPTPFDAIEAKLASAPRERKRQVAYFGAVEGKLSIEPYLVENWLVGLYVMSDAKFTLDM